MTPITTPIIGGIVSLVVTIIISLWMLKRRHADEKANLGWPASLPLLCGLAIGFIILSLFIKTFVSDDRFYTPAEALQILLAAGVGCLLIWLVEIIAPRQRGFAARTAAHLTAQIAAAALLVFAGVRFELMKVPGEGVALLSSWESSLWTVAWLIVATNLIRLLDGIHGAAAVAVIIAGITALFSNLVYDEFFLTGVALVSIGCAAGSIWFCISKKRLPLEGSGTAMLGFLFATLTVLARQKTVATLLLLIPLILIILVAGAAMTGMLEKRLVLPKGRKK